MESDDTIQIDRMKLKDVEGVHRISVESFSVPWSLDAIQNELYNELSFYLVARNKEDGRILGFAGAWLVFDECQITNIAVDSEERRRGIAEALLNEMLMEMKKKDMSVIFLEVRESNVPARSFYEKMGFEYTGLRSGFYQDGEDAMLMTLDLRKPLN